MSGIVTALVINYIMFVGVCVYNFFLKSQLNAYRRNERAKKEIAANSTLEARLLKSGGSVHKY